MSGQDDFNETVKIVAASYTATDNDYNIFVEGQGANATITLPNAAALAGATSNQGLKYVGRQYTVTKDAAAFTVTVAAAGGSMVGPAGAVTLAASAAHSSSWMSDGTNWYAIGNV
jgi:hypothetical protein